MDVQELDAASNRGIDEMRDLLSRVALGTPGRWKVYIVDEVHQLTAGAASALLKTLEEPPGHVVFVLATTDPQKVLPRSGAGPSTSSSSCWPPRCSATLLARRQRARPASACPTRPSTWWYGGATARLATPCPSSTRWRPPGAWTTTPTVVGRDRDGIASGTPARCYGGGRGDRPAGGTPAGWPRICSSTCATGSWRPGRRRWSCCPTTPGAESRRRPTGSGAPTLVRAMELHRPGAHRHARGGGSPDHPRGGAGAAGRPDADDSPAALLERIERLERLMATGAGGAGGVVPLATRPPSCRRHRSPAAHHHAPTAGPQAGARGPPQTPLARGCPGCGHRRGRPSAGGAAAGRRHSPPAGSLPSARGAHDGVGGSDPPRPAAGGQGVPAPPGASCQVDADAAVYAVPDKGLLGRAAPSVPEVEAALLAALRPAGAGAAGARRRQPTRARRGPAAGAVHEDPADYDPTDLQDAPAAVLSPEQRLLEAFPGAEEVQ